MKNLSPIMLTLLFIIIAGCYSVGGHGSIQAYQYHVSKKDLEVAVNHCTGGNVNIWSDTTVRYRMIVNTNTNDTQYLPDNYYNDGITYKTIFINSGEKRYEYTLRYAGSEEDWDTSSVSAISIVYVFDEDGNGGSEDSHDIKANKKLRENILGIFEKELIFKVDKQLGVKHY